MAVRSGIFFGAATMAGAFGGVLGGFYRILSDFNLVLNEILSKIAKNDVRKRMEL